MTKEAKRYSGFEHEQTFVERSMLNPAYDGSSFVLPGGKRIDNRRYVNRPEWDYCVKRHAQFWRDQGEPLRSVPNFRNEGKEGWWFPVAWVREYAEQQKPRRSREAA